MNLGAEGRIRRVIFQPHRVVFKYFFPS